MKRGLVILLCIGLVLAPLSGCAGAKDERSLSADYLIEEAGSARAGLEWTIFALARSGELPESWREEYYTELNTLISKNGGALSESKSTEYARTALAVRALGGDPRTAADEDLLAPLEDAEKTAAQGAVSIAYAILALGEDIGAERCAQYVGLLREHKTPDGGFAPTREGAPDVDMTAICLQALSVARSLCEVEEDIEAALSVLSSIQNADGSFSNYGAPTAESTAQVIIALCALGISPKEDSRFVKDKSVYDALLDFYVKGGGFSHNFGGERNTIASQQALCALAAVSRLESGESALYDFSGGGKLTASLSVHCLELLDNLDALNPEKLELVPEDGIIYERAAAEFSEGESAFELLSRELRSAGVHLDFKSAPVTGGVYIEGLANLYEFDCGPLSGWFYSVNGESLPISSSEYILKDGDELVVEFVCSMRIIG